MTTPTAAHTPAPDDSGPAFPTEPRTNIRAGGTEMHFYAGHYGMTLRDYFAAKALASMLANPNKEGAHCGRGGLNDFPRYAYEWADAMLNARQA